MKLFLAGTMMQGVRLNLIAVYNNGKAGSLTSKEQAVVPLIYDQVSDSLDGLFPVKTGGKWGVVDRGREGGYTLPV